MSAGGVSKFIDGSPRSLDRQPAAFALFDENRADIRLSCDQPRTLSGSHDEQRRRQRVRLRAVRRNHRDVQQVRLHGRPHPGIENMTVASAGAPERTLTLARAAYGASFDPEAEKR